MWIGLVEHRQSRDEAAYAEGFTVPPGVRLADLIADLDACRAETAATIRAVQLDDPVPIPPGVPWFPSDVEAWSVRWVLLHLIEEVARHAGHADIIRESIDGATMHPLMAAVEGWPPTPWLRPWQPPTG
jgi:hypothetical protein